VGNADEQRRCVVQADGHGTVRVVRAIEAAGDVTLQRALVGMVSGRDVHLTMAGAGPVVASGQVAINQGACGPLMSGGGVSIRQGGSGPIIAKGNVSIEQGGCQSVIAAGGATLGRQSFAGMVLSPRIEVQDGAKVLMTVPQAAAFGAAAGVVLALMFRARRR
jgi:hypothetical protein